MPRCAACGVEINLPVLPKWRKGGSAGVSEEQIER